MPIESRAPIQRISALKGAEVEFLKVAKNEPRNLTVISKIFDKGFSDGVKGLPHYDVESRALPGLYELGYEAGIDEARADSYY